MSGINSERKIGLKLASFSFISMLAVVKRHQHENQAFVQHMLMDNNLSNMCSIWQVPLFPTWLNRF